MLAEIISTYNLNDISNKIMQPDGKIKLMLASEWRKYLWNDFRAFCHQYARYGIPTMELIYWLYSHINQKIPLSDCISLSDCLEIGAGAGDLGYHLGVTMTDSKMQENPLIKKHYEMMCQPVIQYPSDVIKMEATEAVNHYKPKVVIASWITPYAPKEMSYGSSPFGIHEDKILDLVDTFILIGNVDTHGNNPIMKIKHEEYYFDWLVSRAKNQDNNRIWIWSKNNEK